VICSVVGSCACSAQARCSFLQRGRGKLVSWREIRGRRRPKFRPSTAAIESPVCLANLQPAGGSGGVAGWSCIGSCELTLSRADWAVLVTRATEVRARASDEARNSPKQTRRRNCGPREAPAVRASTGAWRVTKITEGAIPQDNAQTPLRLSSGTTSVLDIHAIVRGVVARATVLVSGSGESGRRACHRRLLLQGAPGSGTSVSRESSFAPREYQPVRVLPSRRGRTIMRLCRRLPSFGLRPNQCALYSTGDICLSVPRDVPALEFLDSSACAAAIFTASRELVKSLLYSLVLHECSVLRTPWLARIVRHGRVTHVPCRSGGAPHGVLGIDGAQSSNHLAPVLA